MKDEEALHLHDRAALGNPLQTRREAGSRAGTQPKTPRRFAKPCPSTSISTQSSRMF